MGSDTQINSVLNLNHSLNYNPMIIKDRSYRIRTEVSLIMNF